MFKRFFKQERHTEVKLQMSKKYLIVGLGNSGPDYVNSRHNVGFKVVDHFAKVHGVGFETCKLGALASCFFKGRNFLILKPNTFMNLSGKAVKYWLEKEKIPLKNALIITDDLNLPFGTLRIKAKGSAGGHNGLKDIQDKLNSNKYNRLRFGISDTFSKGRQVDYVLGQWNELEFSKLQEHLEISTKIIESFVMVGINNTMNNYNGK